MGSKISKSAAMAPPSPSVRRLRVLCLHGWRTSGQILSTQTAAMRAHTDMEMVFLTAPHAAVGEPDPGIAMFYPDEPYFEWFLRPPPKAVRDDEDEDARANTQVSASLLAGLDESIEAIIEALRTRGPFDGILGFSQGAGMVTRLAYIQQQQEQQPEEQQQQKEGEKEQKRQAVSTEATGTYHPRRFPSTRGLFRFAILIGGVPPQELEPAPDSQPPRLALPSLHIHGRADPYLDRSQRLLGLYGEASRALLLHEEGHNIPSIRTQLYAKINAWLAEQ